MKRLHSVRTALGMMICFTALNAEAQWQRGTDPAPEPRHKTAWEWTPAERAQARSNVDKRHERVAAFATKQLTPSKAMGPRDRAVDVIDGGRNPELYFPTELFEHLVRNSFVTLTEVYPRVVQDRSSDLFRDATEWERFAAIASEYAEVLRQQTAAAKSFDEQRVTELQDVKCTACARALRKARREFGRARFDRMLYETVPVSMVTSFSADTDFELSIGGALQREEHCQ